MNIAAFPIYDSYRNDVAPWLGDVPVDWCFDKAKWFLSYRKQLNSDGKIDNVLSLTLRGVVNNDPDNPEGLVPKDYRTYQIFEADDLVFKLIDLENVRTSRVGLVHEQGIMSSAYIRLVVPEGWNARFLHYYYFRLYQAEVFNKIGSGVRSTLGQSDLLELPIPIVDRSTQDGIVHFLDEKCAKIEEAVRIKDEQIALLRERRQILIQQAVTRGLNPGAPMRDSGIDWIGQIPAHWEVRRFRFLCSIATGSKNTEDKVDGGRYPFFVRSQTAERINTYSYDGEAVLTAGDGAGVGKVYHYVNGKFDFHQRVYKFSNFREVKGKYLFHYLDANFFNVALLGAAKSTVDSLRLPLIQNFLVAFPPDLEEQEDVLAHITKDSEKIESAIAIKQDQIAALKEYKTSLINAAVTGKIKVA